MANHYKVADLQQWVAEACQRCPGFSSVGEEFTLVIQIAIEWNELGIHTEEDIQEASRSDLVLKFLSRAACEVLRIASGKDAPSASREKQNVS